MSIIETISRPTLWALSAFWFLIFVAAHAGGLGIAPIAAVMGGVGLISFTKAQGLRWLKDTPKAVWCVIALLLYGYVSSLWSPYQSGDRLSNPLKLLIGVPLFILATAWILSQNSGLKVKLGTVLLVYGGIWGLILNADIISGYKLTFLIDPPKTGQDPNIKLGDVSQNLGHAISFAALLVVPFIALSWGRVPVERAIGLSYALLVLLAAYVGDMNASFLAVSGAICIFLTGLWKPKIMLGLSVFISAISIAVAPMLAWLANTTTQEFRENLPFSWAERVENWAYMYGKIMEKPMFGHGFDAVRTFNDTHIIRGFEGRAIVSLHPHNAGLHIWAELGLVGAVLVILSLLFALRELLTLNMGKVQISAIAGYIFTVTAISALSYGVWQDWWWPQLYCAYL